MIDYTRIHLPEDSRIVELRFRVSSGSSSMTLAKSITAMVQREVMTLMTCVSTAHNILFAESRGLLAWTSDQTSTWFPMNDRRPHGGSSASDRNILR